jgi:hypothetical protein
LTLTHNPDIKHAPANANMASSLKEATGPMKLSRIPMASGTLLKLRPITNHDIDTA